MHNPYQVLTQPGERAAQERMDHAVSKIVRSYSSLRDIPSEDGTSRLSQDLRYGLISIRTLYTKVEAEHKTERNRTLAIFKKHREN